MTQHTILAGHGECAAKASWMRQTMDIQEEEEGSSMLLEYAGPHEVDCWLAKKSTPLFQAFMACQ